MPRYRGKELDAIYAQIAAKMATVPEGVCQLCRWHRSTGELDIVFADVTTQREEGGELHVQGKQTVRLCDSCRGYVLGHPLSQKLDGDA